VPKPKKLTRRLCRHDTRKNHGGDSMLFRCRCGNVWVAGQFQGSVPQDQGAAAIFVAFSRGPAVTR
jgi:hypothetical protein